MLGNQHAPHQPSVRNVMDIVTLHHLLYDSEHVNYHSYDGDYVKTVKNVPLMNSLLLQYELNFIRIKLFIATLFKFTHFLLN